MQDSSFGDLVNKYSHYLNKDNPTDRATLLRIGTRLFGSDTNHDFERLSFNLLKVKENELAIPHEQTQVRIKSLAPKTGQHARTEQAQVLTQDFISEEIMVLQDKNGLLLSRRKSLEKQRNSMNNSYGKLMEKSIKTKVQLKLQIQKLKAELDDALSRSRPAFMKNKEKIQGKPILGELSDLNRNVLERISSFKMSISNDNAYYEKAVLDRYTPKMEKKLGQIYPHSEYLPITQVHEKFSGASEKIEHKMRDIETGLKNEHERNEQLQNEAKQLEIHVMHQTEEVNKIKRRNLQLVKEISLLKDISIKPIRDANLLHKRLMNVDDDLEGTPSSARAIVSMKGCENKKIKRSPSAKWITERDTAYPRIKSVQEIIDEQRQKVIELLHS